MWRGGNSIMAVASLQLGLGAKPVYLVCDSFHDTGREKVRFGQRRAASA